MYSIKFSDAANNGVDSKWYLHSEYYKFCIYSGHPDRGGVLLARMLAVGTLDFDSASEYTVEIAANVDIAIIAMLSIIVEQMRAEAEVARRT